MGKCNYTRTMPVPMPKVLLFSRAKGKKKDFPFFPFGATPSRTVPKTQKPGDPPNFRKNALGVKGPFSELSESSGVFSGSSRNWKFHSRNTKFHSRNGLSRLDQYETHNSRSNSRSDSRNCREPTRKIFICPCILGAFFQELGWSPRTRKTQPLQVAFALQERVDLRSQTEEILGKKIAWGRVGRTGQKKGCTKKKWAKYCNLIP